MGHDLHSVRLMSIYHLIYLFLFINLYLDVFQGVFIGNKQFFLTLKHFWHPVLLKYGYFWGEGVWTPCLAASLLPEKLDICIPPPQLNNYPAIPMLNSLQ